MRLNMEKKTIISCDYNEIEDIIFKHFGHRYEIMPMEEIGSSQYAAVAEYSVRETPLDEYEVENLDTLWEGKPSQYILSSILTHLCNQGLLDAGDYLIDVNW
jgi:hypothetical protein